MKTAVQQIMLGKVCIGMDKAAEALNTVKKAGYDGIELNRFMIHPSPLVVRILTKATGMPTGRSGNLDWTALVRDSGLEVTALHTDLGSLEKDFGSVASDAERFGTDRIVITGMYRFDYRDRKAVSDLSDRLSKAGKQLKENGMQLYYHNHNAEMQRVSDSERAMDVLFSDTDPDLVRFELDTYWLAEAGADPLEWMEKAGKRMGMWHVTDRGTRLSKAPMTPMLSSDSVEVGYGNMPLGKLAEQADRNGVDVMVLETHRNWAEGSPLRSIELSAPAMLELSGKNS
ncbi:MAG: sugar phosphate isomerase/epimerase [Oscillospiraceae bacterium]|nr:sugar phosphate isomerase/epimerase [Oscillospiraceae bacterium]